MGALVDVAVDDDGIAWIEDGHWEGTPDMGIAGEALALVRLDQGHWALVVQGLCTDAERRCLAVVLNQAAMSLLAGYVAGVVEEDDGAGR
jgi:hypothetical protein